jgi:hypothetical protein
LMRLIWQIPINWKILFSASLLTVIAVIWTVWMYTTVTHFCRNISCNILDVVVKQKSLKHILWYFWQTFSTRVCRSWNDLHVSCSFQHFNYC